MIFVGWRRQPQKWCGQAKLLLGHLNSDPTPTKRRFDEGSHYERTLKTLNSTRVQLDKVLISESLLINLRGKPWLILRGMDQWDLNAWSINPVKSSTTWQELNAMLAAKPGTGTTGTTNFFWLCGYCSGHCLVHDTCNCTLNKGETMRENPAEQRVQRQTQKTAKNPALQDSPGKCSCSPSKAQQIPSPRRKEFCSKPAGTPWP